MVLFFVKVQSIYHRVLLQRDYNFLALVRSLHNCNIMLMLNDGHHHGISTEYKV